MDKSAVAFVFYVTVYGNLGLFQRFLHNFLVLGLLVDEESGEVIVLEQSVKHSVYIELPEVSSESSNELVRCVS